jgi:hypothetical protein
LHAAFEKSSHAELLGDLRQISERALGLRRRSDRNDFEIFHLGQAGKYLLFNPLCKVGVVWIAAEIFKRQHRDDFWGNRLASLPIKRASRNDQHCNNQQQHPDNDEVEDPAGSALKRSRP